MAADFLIFEKLWASWEPSETINRDKALKLDINMSQQPTTFYIVERGERQLLTDVSLQSQTL